MIAMSNLGYDQQIVIRSIPAVKLAFDRMVVEMRSAGRLRVRGRKITREAFANAVWLRLSRMTIPEIEAWLGPDVARFEALLTGAADPATVEPAPPLKAMDAPSVIVEHMPDRTPKRKGRTG